MNKAEHWITAALIASADLAVGTAYYTEGADWILYSLGGIFIGIAIRRFPYRDGLLSGGTP
jgi:hypothetical protein